MWALGAQGQARAAESLPHSAPHSQLHCLPYAVDTQHTTGDSDPSRDIVDELFSIDSAGGDHGIDNRQVCSSGDHAATPHSPMKEHLNIDTTNTAGVDAQLVRNAAPVRGGTRGRGQGAGASAGASAGALCTSGQLSEPECGTLQDSSREIQWRSA